METSEDSSAYHEGFEQGKSAKLSELLPFQAREHALFISAQVSFYGSFLDTLTPLLPLFKVSDLKLSKYSSITT